MVDSIRQGIYPKSHARMVSRVIRLLPTYLLMLRPLLGTAAASSSRVTNRYDSNLFNQNRFLLEVKRMIRCVLDPLYHGKNTITQVRG